MTEHAGIGRLLRAEHLPPELPGEWACPRAACVAAALGALARRWPGRRWAGELPAAVADELAGSPEWPAGEHVAQYVVQCLAATIGGEE